MRGTGTAAVLELCDVASVAYVSTPVKSSTTVAHSFLRLVSKVQDAALRSTLLLSYCRHLNEHREQVWRNIIILFDVQRIAVPCVWFGDLESLKNEVELPVPMVLDGNKLTAQRSKRRMLREEGGEVSEELSLEEYFLAKSLATSMSMAFPANTGSHCVAKVDSIQAG